MAAVQHSFYTLLGIHIHIKACHKSACGQIDFIRLGVGMAHMNKITSTSFVVLEKSFI